MKTQPAIEALVGSSHRYVTRVDVHDAAGALVREGLPVRAGTVTASAVDMDRWTVSLTLAGDLFMPVDPDDPLSGFSRATLRVHAGVGVGDRDETVPLCVVTPVASRMRRDDGTVTVDVECVGPAGWMMRDETTADLSAYSTCQQAIEALVAASDPPGWSGTVVDNTPSAGFPADYPADGPAWQIVEDLMAFADITGYFDAAGDLVLRPYLPDSVASWDHVLGVGGTVVSYDRETGTGYGFANHVTVRFVQDDRDDVTGVAQQTTGPLGTATVGTVKYEHRRRGHPSASVAQALAADLLPVTLRAWSTVIVTAVPNPLWEPDDTVRLTLDDVTLYCRLTRAQIPLAPGEAATLSLRVLPAGSYTP